MTPFCLLCATVCLAVLFLGSLIGLVLAGAGSTFLRNVHAQRWLLRYPTLLFSIRIFPLAFGMVCSVGFALPSFLVLEPRAEVEKPELFLLLIAVLTMAGISLVVFRLIRLFVATQATARAWLERGRRLPLDDSVPVYEIESPESMIAIVGILRPRVFIGRRAVSSLSLEELRAAIAHELVHCRVLDNFKQLVLRATRLPRCLKSFAAIEMAWFGASELAADSGALQQGTSAVDLCSAIVKIARLAADLREPAFIVACHLVPPDHSTVLAVRVQRLQDFLAQTGSARLNQRSPLWMLWPLLIVCYFLSLPAAVPMVHRLIEWLVR